MVWNLTSISRAFRAQALWRELWFGPHGTYSSAWREIVDSDPMMRDVVMAVDVILGGGLRFRMATRTDGYDLGTGLGADRIGAIGLLTEEPEVDHVYQLGTGTSSARTFTISVSSPGLDPWKIIQEQGRFLAGWAEVSLVHPDLNWQDRFVLMRGDMSGGVGFGVAREQVTFRVSDPKVSADIGITEWVADDDRFSDLPDAYQGERISLAINEPRTVACLRTTDSTPPTFLVCYEHNHDVADGDVFVDGESKAQASADFPWSVDYLYEDLGVPYTAVVFTAGTGTFEDTTAVHASLSLRSDRNIDPINVVQTIRHLAEQWSMLGPAGTSGDAFARAESKVQDQGAPAIFINGSGESDATRALEYVESTICRSFPMISMAWQPGGYGPVITDKRRPPHGKWVVRQYPLFKRESAEWEERPKTELYNWFTLRYDYDAVNDVYNKVITRNPNNNLLCQISEEQAGPRDLSPIESTIIVDDQTATWVIDWLVAHMALPSYYCEYSAAPSVLLRYRLGDNIDLVDDEIHGVTLDNPIRVSIERILYARAKATVGLRLWPLYPNLGGGAASGETPFAGAGDPSSPAP